MPGITPVAPQVTGYRAVKFLGSGGFGDVFHYKHETTSAAVAVKVLRDGVSAAGAQELLHEAQALGRLSAAGAHPNIVAVQDVGKVGGRPYLIMEYCPGGSWADLITNKGKLHPSKVLSVGIQIAGALFMAHQAGIVHRDIKPGNILIGAQGVAKLADFGIAALTAEEAARGSAWLSHDYAAPEVVESGEADQLSDLFALAATLYHALTGMPATRQPATAAGIPESLDWLLRAAMAPDRTIRGRSVPDAREFAMRLRDIQFELHYDRTPVPISVSDPGAHTHTSEREKRVWAPKAREAQALADTDVRYEPAPMVVAAPPRRRVKLLAGIGAAVLVAGAVTIAALTFSSSPGTPLQTPGANGDAAIPERQPVPVPKVQGNRIDAGSVEFTWTYTDPQQDDSFRITAAGGMAERSDKPKWTVTAPGPQICVEVMVVRADGRTTATGGKACA